MMNSLLAPFALSLCVLPLTVPCANALQFNKTYEALFSCCVIEKGKGFYQGGLLMPVSDSLDDDESINEAQFAANIQQDLEEAEQEYDQVPETQGGKIIDTDLARRLYPQYSDALSPDKRLRFASATSMPANALVDYLYNKKLYRLIKNHNASSPPLSIVMLAGGYGSGKTTSIRELQLPVLENANLIRDRSMDEPLSTPQEMIDAALTLNIKVTIIYVFRPIESAIEGILTRANKEGRISSLWDTADAHWRAQDNVLSLKEHFGDQIEVIVIDNSDSVGSASIVSSGIDFLKKTEINYGSLDNAWQRAKDKYNSIDKSQLKPEVIDILEKGFYTEEKTEYSTYWPTWLKDQVERWFGNSKRTIEDEL